MEIRELRYLCEQIKISIREEDGRRNYSRIRWLKKQKRLIRAKIERVEKKLHF